MNVKNIVVTGVLGMILLAGLFALPSCSGDADTPLKLMEAAADARKQARLKTIESAAAMYMTERGRSADTLQELVRTGYLSEQDILDDRGKPYAYTPEDGPHLPERLTKSCGRCGQSVPDTSMVGDRCPHCNVRWGYEQKL